MQGPGSDKKVLGMIGRKANLSYIYMSEKMELWGISSVPSAVLKWNILEIFLDLQN